MSFRSIRLMIVPFYLYFFITSFAIENAVKGMLPKNKLQNERMKRLRVFAGENHDHTAQQPRKVEVK